MHEMSLAESVLQMIEGMARSQDFKSVKMVRLEIGQLSSVEPEAFRFAFEAVTRGSIASGACLDVIETAGQGLCMECSAQIPLSARYEPCSACGSHKVRVTGGEGMRVRELEVE